MQYTLITRQGKIMQFYVLSLAEVYQGFTGGVIVSSQCLQDEVSQVSVDI
jgi:hypothetical protein